MDNALVTCENLVKIYTATDLEVVALQGLDLEIAPGEMVALVGASGSGKSTLLNLLGALDAPSAGRCVVSGNDLTRLNEQQRTNYRCFTAGHVWQQSGRNLLPELSVAENIALPQMLGGANAKSRARRTRELMERTGIERLADKKPNQISGGEQQRAAVCVALANAPTLLLADEPTGELDSTTAGEVLELLRELNRELGLTILIVTHDVNVASGADRTIAIRDGRTSTETVRRDAPLAASTGSGSAAGVASAVIGLPSQTHRESILIDRVGRLQLPHEALVRVPFNGRADVRILDDHVEIWPDAGAAEELAASQAAAPAYPAPSSAASHQASTREEA
ncbi:MAG TPA: ABC transporter ATP-binding protein [Ktedonobacterales bacterium]|nr:ABC transporter ATP-binding protein [Ktedonobacterales bacterium]